MTDRREQDRSGFLEERERIFLEMVRGRAPEMAHAIDEVVADLARRREDGEAGKLWHALTDRHVVDPDTADDILDTIKYQRIVDGLRAAGVDVRMPFGREDHLFARLALQRDVLTHAELEEAIATQSRLCEAGVEKPLGEVVFDAEIMGKDAIDGVVAAMGAKIALRGRYNFLDPRLSDEDDTRLGSILKSQGIVPETEITKALKVQSKLLEADIWKPLGEILFEGGFLTLDQLHTALGRQTAARTLKAPRRRRRRRSSSPVGLLVGAAVAVAALVVVIAVFSGGTPEKNDRKDRTEDEPARSSYTPPEETDVNPFSVGQPPPKKPAEPLPSKPGETEPPPRTVDPKAREMEVLEKFARAVRKASAKGFKEVPGGLDFGD